MALPSVGGGYQFNDGNLNELKVSVAAAPTTAVDSDTLTAGSDHQRHHPRFSVDHGSIHAAAGCGP
jgi:hypothetical protein